jgi:site-specific DNA-methyltransferase (adenine-specific)
LKKIETGSIDLMLTDPPYAVTQNQWDVEIPLAKLWEEWERVVKPNGAFIFTSQFPFTIDLILSKKDLFRYDLIWYKPLGSGYLNANKMPMRNHEHILVFYRKLPTYNPQKGIGERKRFNRKHDRNGPNYGRFATEETSNFYDDKGMRNPQSVIEFSNGDRTSESDHPTQKPIALFQYLIKTYSNPGDTVFDGYLGSGTCAHAAISEGRSFVGSEKDPDYFAAAKKRIENHVKQLPLFGPVPTINFFD